MIGTWRYCNGTYDIVQDTAGNLFFQEFKTREDEMIRGKLAERLYGNHKWLSGDIFSVKTGEAHGVIWLRHDLALGKTISEYKQAGDKTWNPEITAMKEGAVGLVHDGRISEVIVATDDGVVQECSEPTILANMGENEANHQADASLTLLKDAESSAGWQQSNEAKEKDAAIAQLKAKYLAKMKDAELQVAMEKACKERDNAIEQKEVQHKAELERLFAQKEAEQQRAVEKAKSDRDAQYRVGAEWLLGQVSLQPERPAGGQFASGADTGSFKPECNVFDKNAEHEIVRTILIECPGVTAAEIEETELGVKVRLEKQQMIDEEKVFPVLPIKKSHGTFEQTFPVTDRHFRLCEEECTLEHGIFKIILRRAINIKKRILVRATSHGNDIKIHQPEEFTMIESISNSSETPKSEDQNQQQRAVSNPTAVLESGNGLSLP